jgi:ornithine cyclodeaminase/alanine dehydrogenase-like protein (mu-crystallin family)
LTAVYWRTKVKKETSQRTKKSKEQESLAFLRLGPEPCLSMGEAEVHEIIMESPQEFCALLERFYAYWDKNREMVDLPAKQIFSTPGLAGDFRVMPCAIHFEGKIIKAVKVIGTNEEERVVPDKICVGKAMLLHPTDNFAQALFDVCALSSFRTAAVSVLAFKHCLLMRETAIPGIGLAGTGRIGFYTALFLNKWLGVKEISCFDPNPLRLGDFESAVYSCMPEVAIKRKERAGDLIYDSDSIFLCTNSSSPVLSEKSAGHLSFISSVGADADNLSEIDEDMAGKREIVVDSVQSMALGDLKRWEDKGLIKREQVLELPGFVSGAYSSSRKILFVSTGIAVQDALASQFLFDKTRNSLKTSQWTVSLLKRPLKVSRALRSGEKMSKHLFRSQFILGPHYIHTFEDWNKTQTAGRFFITSHPNLSLCQVSSGHRSLTLLGYMVDPLNPDHDDRLILEGLLAGFEDLKALIKKTRPLGGRWMLLARKGESIWLVPDTIGLRQVFYTDITGREIWCASQPSLLASLLNLKEDGNARDFLRSYEKANNEFWLPGDLSLYREIKHLLPNHYLDLKTGHAFRFWPDGPRREIPFDSVLESSCALLKGLVEGAAKRLDIVLSLTAGIDSRVVLAASKGVKDRIAAMTIQRKPEVCADTRVASALAAKFGLKHSVLRPPESVRGDFRAVYERNALFPHEVWIRDAQAIFDYSAGEKSAMTGSVSEVARCWYPRYRGMSITEQVLSRMKGMKNGMAAREFRRWLDGYPDTCGYHILDLFCWEQGEGNWLAMCQLEFDAAWKDIFTPFNCRELLATMLSASESMRRGPRYELHMQIIEKLWPELLSEPINPHKKMSFFQGMKKSLIFRLQSMKYSFEEYA